jgi:hypothetical protein
VGVRLLSYGPEQHPAADHHDPSEAEARARTAAALVAAREAAGLSIDHWAELWGRALGRPVSPDLVRAWESPSGPKPLLHWTYAVCRAAGAPAQAVMSSLFSA